MKETEGLNFKEDAIKNDLVSYYFHRADHPGPKTCSFRFNVAVFHRASNLLYLNSPLLLGGTLL